MFDTPIGYDFWFKLTVMSVIFLLIVLIYKKIKGDNLIPTNFEGFEQKNKFEMVNTHDDFYNQIFDHIHATRKKMLYDLESLKDKLNGTGAEIMDFIDSGNTNPLSNTFPITPQTDLPQNVAKIIIIRGDTIRRIIDLNDILHRLAKTLKIGGQLLISTANSVTNNSPLPRIEGSKYTRSYDLSRNICIEKFVDRRTRHVRLYETYYNGNDDIINKIKRLMAEYGMSSEIDGDYVIFKKTTGIYM